MKIILQLDIRKQRMEDFKEENMMETRIKRRK